MHLKTFATLVALSLAAGSLGAAEATVTASTAGTVVMPTTVVPSTTPAPALTPNQIVYTPRLPTAAELTTAAASQNLAVERIEQTATQIVAVYKNAGGQINTVAYQTLPPAGTPTPAYVTTTPPPTVVTTPAPTVVYEQPAPRVIYYDDDPLYYPYPRVWYPPVSVRLGFGFNHFYGHGGFRRWR